MNAVNALRRLRVGAVRALVRDAARGVGGEVWRVRAYGVLATGLVAVATVAWDPRAVVLALAVAVLVVSVVGALCAPRLTLGPATALLLATVITATWTDTSTTRAVSLSAGIAAVWAAQSVLALGATLPPGCRVQSEVTRTWWRWTATSSLGALAAVALVALIGHAAAHPPALVAVGVLAALTLLAAPTVRAWRRD